MRKLLTFIFLSFYTFAGLQAQVIDQPLFDDNYLHFGQNYDTNTYSDPLTVTVYNATEDQTDDTPRTTASGLYINDIYNPPNIIAVSRDLLAGYPLGTQVYLVCRTCPFTGNYTVQDVMNARYTNRIDILISPLEPIGLWENGGTIIKLR